MVQTTNTNVAVKTVVVLTPPMQVRFLLGVFVHSNFRGENMEDLKWYEKMLAVPIAILLVITIAPILKVQRFRFKRNLIKRGYSKKAAEYQAKITEEHDCFYGWPTGNEDCYKRG